MATAAGHIGDPVSLATHAIALVEHLLMKRRARVVDPLIAALALALRKRFRSQAKWWQITGGFTGFADHRFDQRYGSLMEDAWQGGAAELGSPLARRQPRTAETMTDEIDRTTSERVSSVIRDAVERGLTRPQMERELRELFREWGSKLEDSRSSLIARNEIAAAYNGGLLAAAKASDKTMLKSWWADPDACDICLENVEDEPIALDEPFASGDDAPPAHPFCRCSLRIETAEES